MWSSSKIKQKHPAESFIILATMSPFVVRGQTVDYWKVAMRFNQWSLKWKNLSELQ